MHLAALNEAINPKKTIIQYAGENGCTMNHTGINISYCKCAVF